IVVAPSSSAIWTTSAMNSTSERDPSSGENSTSSVYALAWATAARACPFTSSRVVWSLRSMWMSLVAMKVWMRGRSESLIAFQAASMSWKLVRARPQITGPCTSRAIDSTASKSPGEVIGKPASMMSTPRRASCCAISSFSARFREIPGDCSPSRRVVSKIRTRSSSRLPWVVSSVMSFLSVPRLGLLWSRGFAAATRYSPRRGRRRSRSESWNVIARLTLQSEHHLAHVLAVRDVAVRFRPLPEREGLGHHGAELSGLGPPAEWLEVLVERAVGVPEREHVQPDHRLGLGHHWDGEERGHLDHGPESARDAPLLALGDGRRPVAHQPAARAQE